MSIIYDFVLLESFIAKVGLQFKVRFEVFSFRVNLGIEVLR